MPDIKIGGTYRVGARQRSEPLQFEDATGNVSPVFEGVARIVNPDYPEHGEVTFLAGEAKPQWVVDLEHAGAATPPDAAKNRPNKPVTAT